MFTEYEAAIGVTIVGEIPAPPFYLDEHLGLGIASGPLPFTNKIHLSSFTRAGPRMPRCLQGGSGVQCVRRSRARPQHPWLGPTVLLPSVALLPAAFPKVRRRLSLRACFGETASHSLHTVDMREHSLCDCQVPPAAGSRRAAHKTPGPWPVEST
jgi:hypothetical protein